MIKFACPQCGQHISVDDKYAGKKGRCPKCKETVIVPGGSPAIRFTCDGCGHKIKVPSRYAGKKGRCPKCQNPVVVPAPDREAAAEQEPTPKPKPAPELQKTTTVACGMCGQAIPVPPDQAEGYLECPACGSTIDAATGEIASPYDDVPAAESEEDYGDESDETPERSAGPDRRLIFIIAGAAAVVVVAIVVLVVVLKSSKPSRPEPPVAGRERRQVAREESQPQPTAPTPTDTRQAPAASTVQLRFAPAPGTERIVQVATETISSSPENALQQSGTNRETLTFELEVLPPDDSGNTPIAVTLAAVQMKAESNGKVDAQYDSTAPLDSTNHFGKLYSPFVSGRCTMTVSAQGRIVDFDTDKFYHAVAEVRFAAQGGTIDPRYASREEQLAALKTQSENFPSLGKEQLCGTLEKLVAALPEQPLRPGDTWSGRSTMDFGVPLDMASTYTLATADDKVCTIEIDRRRGAEEAPALLTSDNLTISYALSGTSQAALTVDRHTGWLLSSEEKVTLSGQMERHRTDKEDEGVTDRIAVAITTTVTTLEDSLAEPEPQPQRQPQPQKAAQPWSIRPAPNFLPPFCPGFPLPLPQPPRSTNS